MFSRSGKAQVRFAISKQRSQQLAENISDIIVPRGMQNRVAIDMIVKHIQRTLAEKSKMHRYELQRLEQEVEDEPLSPNVLLVEQTKQFVGMSTILQDPATDDVDFNFYFNRMATYLVERQVCQVLAKQPEHPSHARYVTNLYSEQWTP